jgi:hypothetical protein
MPFSGEPPVSSSDDTPSRTCKCGRPFSLLYPEQLRCLRCRQLQLSLDSRRRDDLEIDAFNTLRTEWNRSETDWQLQDPDHPGALIWAGDLAKRYRSDTKPRPVRNNLTKWL